MVAELYGNPMAAARTMLGASERGPGAAELNDFLTTGGANLDPSTTAWCAAFVNAALGQSGVEGTGKMNARSFMDWGQPVDQPQPGDVAVFSRGDPNGWEGHVGFYQGTGPDGKIQVLGGNQGDSVSVAGYDPGRLLGYRRAATPGFNPNAPQPGIAGGVDPTSLAAMFKPKQQPDAAQPDRAAQEKERRRALYDLPGLYG